MTDKVTKEKRSYIMSRIKGKNTSPEMKLKNFLKVLNFVHQPKGVYGHPDFANRKAKIAIFVDGCFWHGCDKHYRVPKSNVAFWKKKISRNMEQDKKVNLELNRKGWRVIRVWEHDLNF